MNSLAREPSVLKYTISTISTIVHYKVLNINKVININNISSRNSIRSSDSIRRSNRIRSSTSGSSS